MWDAGGNAYIDAMASLWYCQVGHGRKEMVEAISNQVATLAAYNTFDPWTNGPAEQLAAMVVDRSPLSDGRVFLTCSGSEAVDTALKLARQHFQLKGATEKQIIARRAHGYHGVNYGGTSAQGIEANRTGWGDLVGGFIEIPHDDIEGAASVLAEHGDRLAAVITEPIQGAGGVFPPEPGYLEGLRRICDQHGALLIIDEVICGFGRLGQWFGNQHFDVRPDLMTFAKGVTSGYIPLGGVVVSRDICDTLEADPDFILRHGYTYSGHPTSCAAAVANIELMETEELLARAGDVGERLSSGLRALADDGQVEAVRGDGAVWAADLGPDGDAMGVRDKILTEGVIVRGLNTSIIFCPPLVISDAEIDRCVDAVAKATS